MAVEGEEPEEYHGWTGPPGPRPPGQVTVESKILMHDGVLVPLWLVFKERRDARLGVPNLTPVDGPCGVVGWEDHFLHCPARRSREAG